MHLNRTVIGLIAALMIITGCSKKQDIESRPFIFTIETDFSHAVVHIPIERIENAPILYDLDCNGDGIFEQKSLTDGTDCKFEG